MGHHGRAARRRTGVHGPTATLAVVAVLETAMTDGMPLLTWLFIALVKVGVFVFLGVTVRFIYLALTGRNPDGRRHAPEPPTD